MPPRRSSIPIILTLIAAAMLPGCAAHAERLQRFEFSEIIMGVEARIVLFTAEENQARAAARAAFDRIIELDAVMTDYRPASELMRVTAEANTRPGERIPTSDDLYRVLERSQAFARASAGAFDITVGPAVQVWRDARADGALPDPDVLRNAMDQVGWNHLLLHPDPPSVSFRRAGMRLDLGGIGKGFAADEARLILAQHGCDRFLIGLGGDLVIGDAPPGRRGWRVAISAASPGRTLVLTQVAVATSGDTEQFVEIDGVRYSHIIDPRTGIGLTSRIAVTVVAPDGTTADALASAISVLGAREGRALAARYPNVRVFIEHAAPTNFH